MRLGLVSALVAGAFLYNLFQSYEYLYFHRGYSNTFSSFHRYLNTLKIHTKENTHNIKYFSANDFKEELKKTKIYVFSKYKSIKFDYVKPAKNEAILAKVTVPIDLSLGSLNIGKVSTPDKATKNSFITDTLSIISSSRKRTKLSKQTKNDEMVFFDYTKNSSVQNETPRRTEIKKTNVFDRSHISKRLKNIIHRELHTDKKYDYLSSKGISSEKFNNLSTRSLLSVHNKKSNIMSDIKRSLIEEVPLLENHGFNLFFKKVEIDRPKGHSFLSNYSFSSIDEHTHIKNYNSGISLKRGYYDKGNITGYISSNGYLTVNLDASEPKNVDNFVIPTFERNNFKNLLSELKVNGLGGHLLIKNDDEVKKIRISRDYSAKMNLDINFKQVTDDQIKTYVFFIGIEPGLTLIRYENQLGEFASKITYLKENQLTFVKDELNYHKEIQFQINEENILSKKNYKLNANDLKSYYGNFNFKRIGNGYYRGFSSFYMQNKNNYVTINYLDAPLVFTLPQKEITLPSLEYILHIFKTFDIEDLKSRCLVQLNVEKPLNHFNLGSVSKENLIYFNIKYLDEDGVFRDELSSETVKIFVLGEGNDLNKDFGSILDLAHTSLKNISRRKKVLCLRDQYLITNIE